MKKYIWKIVIIDQHFFFSTGQLYEQTKVWSKHLNFKYFINYSIFCLLQIIQTEDKYKIWHVYGYLLCNFLCCF